MKISVAMATFNGAEFLSDQLSSILKQTRTPDELVIGDDGSSDSTCDIIEKFCRLAPFPVRYSRNDKTLGHSDNFLHTALRCSGDWIALCDQDDVWLPNKLQVVEEKINNNRNDLLMVVHSSQVVNSNLEDTGIRKPDFEKESLKGRGSLGVWWVSHGMSTIFYGDLVRKVPFDRRGTDQRRRDLRPMSHDFWLGRLAQGLGSVLLIPETLALYRRHDGAVTEFGKDRLPRDNSSVSRYANKLDVRYAAQWMAGTRDAIRSQAVALEEIRSRIDNCEWRIELEELNSYLTEYAEWLGKRCNIYSGDHVYERVDTLVRLIFNRRLSYRKFAGKPASTVQAMGKDFLCALRGTGIDSKA